MHKIAVVGGGKWGLNHIRTLNSLKVLGAIVETDPKRREQLESQFPDVPVYDCLTHILNDPGIIGATVATPAETHYETAKRLLLAGKHAMVEKPITLFSAQAIELNKIASERKLVLMVGHLLLFHPAIRKIKQFIDDGTLGTVQYIYSNRVNLGTIRKEENILWSFAPHDIAVISYLVGDNPISVDAKGGMFLQPGIHDVTVTHLTYPKNIIAHIHVSWLHPFKEQRLVVIGDKNMVVFEDSRPTDKLVLYPKGIDWVNGNPVQRDGKAYVVDYEPIQPLSAELEEFIRCIETGDKPVNDGINGLRVLEVLEKAQEKLIGHPVTQPSTPTPEKKPYYVHPTAIVDEPCEIGEGTKLWHFCHVMKNAKIGKNCIFGQNDFIANDVIIGSNVKVQNNVSIYTGTIIEDDVFLGPSCVLTNVTNPRSQVLRHTLYETTLLRRGCSIGANATIVCGCTIGRYAFIGAGAVIAKDVPDYALMMGCPGRQKGWMSRHGLPLKNPDSDGIMICPESGYRYRLVAPDKLVCLDIDEEEPLPQDKAIGELYYDELIHPKG